MVRCYIVDYTHASDYSVARGLVRARSWASGFASARAPYVDACSTRRPGRAPLDQTLQTRLEASFKARSICHSDIHDENFLLGEDKKIWTIDFQHGVSVLPPAFLTFALFNTGEEFASAVGKRLGYQPSNVSNAIVKAACLLYQLGGDASLG
ncbi:uncharacterized protein BXZ73DRAFT_100736 [Epithele typhae]|uniref:uncharacterized protein n=1 Tax=Epithele typhae TaxID=378194 RepID=UPI002007EAF1|nr:uncharacterized protein BXZ73DRAFT_100736 [Epithele typhae]KAH9934545.1 hypothetical protein BXZ73DRAFT_100736 [Epithele typhae]